MAPVSGRKFLDQQLVEIKRRTQAGDRVAVSFDIDNTLFDTRGRAFAIGKDFDKANHTTYFTGKTAKGMGNDAKETAGLVGMSVADAKKFSAFWFRNFFKGENYQNDLTIKQTVTLAKKAAAAGADVYYVTARTQSEEAFTIKQLTQAGLTGVDDKFVVSKAKMKDKTPEYKAGELAKIAHNYDFVPWFITESRQDIRGVQRLNAPVTSVLLETKFSGTGTVSDETPIWKVDVK
ncbi:MAG: superfamily, subfamily (Acid phosphatase) [Myxococcaceae bacterium]|nr:superfamily, subfamily (Acid phosphatase) [Myxococcaceae bacterium]